MFHNKAGVSLFCGISLKKSRRSRCSRRESWFIRCCSASCTVRRRLSPFQCHSGEVFLTCAHLNLPLLSTILHKNMTASLSVKYANLMHLWCRSACFNLFWDLNKRVFYYMVQQTPFQSWTSILVHSWLVTDQISIASCILVLVTCDTRLKIQNRSELLQRAQASSISTHALGLDPWTLGLLPHPFPQNKLFLHQELKKCVHIIIPHICHFFYTDRIFKNQILHLKKRLRH